MIIAPGKNIWRGGLMGAAALVVLAAGAARGATQPAIGLDEGKMVPDFLLPSLDGGYGRLSDFRGKKVFLFHFASW